MEKSSEKTSTYPIIPFNFHSFHHLIRRQGGGRQKGTAIGVKIWLLWFVWYTCTAIKIRERRTIRLTLPHITLRLTLPYHTLCLTIPYYTLP